MAGKLELDRYYLMTKKDLEGKSGFLDRRKFRAQQTQREKTLKLIIESLEKLGIENSSLLANDLIKIKKIYQLNKLLLCMVYKYYESKGFSLENIIKNFEEDFQEQVNIIFSLGIFKKLIKNKNKMFKFRQDFIIYLFIIDEFYESINTEQDDYYDYDTSNSYDNSYVEIEEVEPEFPDDAGFD
jgi:hypothetical protein